MKICVIIPARDEAAAIGQLVKAIKKYTPEVLVVNDASADNTEESARQSGANVLNLKKSMGKGNALRRGFDYAVKNSYDAVLTMDGDGQHSPEDIPAIISSAGSPCVGVVAGNRMINPKNMPLLRLRTNLFMSYIISLVCRQNIPDTQCGYRLIKCEVLKKIHLFSLNYEIESELLIKAGRAGYKIISVPVKSRYDGEISLINPALDTWRFFVMLFRVFI